MIKTMMLSLLLLMPLTACSNSVQDNDVHIKIAGMTCEVCAQTLIKKFSKEKSIESAYIDWENGEGVITQKPEQRISDVTIEKIVDWSGFELISIDRN